MIPRRLFYLLFALMALALDSPGVLAQREQSTVAGSGSTPGEGDIAIMQKEIKWGMQEMQRYKLLKGEWPVRPMAAAAAEAEFPPKKPSLSDDESSKSIRGQKPKETAHSNYWNLLVSVF